MANELENNKLLLVSISVPEIELLDPKNAYKFDTKNKSGHMILVKGISKDNFIIHDPRNVGIYTKNINVNYKTLRKIFNGNGIVINGA